MKSKLIIITIFLVSLFLVGTAFALPYSVVFDNDGSGSNTGVEIWGFDTEGIAQYSVDGGPTKGTTFIKQNLGTDGILNNGDTFTEIFTTKVSNGVDSIGNQNTNSYFILNGQNLKIDISLGGYIYDYNNGGDGDTTRTDYAKIMNDSYFTQMNSGSATMYIDMDSNDIFSTGDVIAATFGFSSAAPSFLSANVWPNGGGSALYSVAMSIDSVNNDDTFWTDGSFPLSLDDLIANGLIFTYNDGSAHAVGIMGDPLSDNNTINLSFSDNGIDLVFDAVPEPATLLLFGVGLLGLAGLSRKKSS